MKKFLKNQKGVVYFSILLSMLPILLMGVGIGVYNSAQGTITEATYQMSKHEKDIYNSAISSYLGVDKKGIDARSCIDAIIASNNNNVGDSGKFIALTINGTTIGTPGNQNNDATEVQNCATQMSTQRSSINVGKRYTITARYNSEGLIEEVTIEE